MAAYESDSQMSESPKRNAEEAGFEEPSTEDLEAATYAISRCAFAAREQLVQKAKAHFRRRNSREITEDELTDTFNTLRDRMVDEDAAAESSGDDEDECDDIDALHADMQDAYQAASDLGKQHRKYIENKVKKLCQEEFGDATSEDATKAVFYHLEHQVRGQVPVEDEDVEEDQIDYEPTDAEKEAAEAEQDFAQEEPVSFDFPNSCKVSEEQVEQAVEKFCEHTGRAPTEEEFEALIQAFSTKITDGSLSSGDDYTPSEEAESEDESVEEDNSLCRQADFEMEEVQEEQQAEPKPSNAFQYMKELGEVSEEEESEKEEEEQPEDEAEPEPTKAQQAEKLNIQTQVCA